MIKRLLILLSIIISTLGKAQCPQVYDYLGNLSPHPYFISCTGTSYNLNFQSNISWGAYTINYGDGSPTVPGASYSANTILTLANTKEKCALRMFMCGKFPPLLLMEKPLIKLAMCYC